VLVPPLNSSVFVLVPPLNSSVFVLAPPLNSSVLVSAETSSSCCSEHTRLTLYPQSCSVLFCAKVPHDHACSVPVITQTHVPVGPRAARRRRVDPSAGCCWSRRWPEGHYPWNDPPSHRTACSPTEGERDVRAAGLHDAGRREHGVGVRVRHVALVAERVTQHHRGVCPGLHPARRNVARNTAEHRMGGAAYTHAIIHAPYMHAYPPPPPSPPLSLPFSFPRNASPSFVCVAHPSSTHPPIHPTTLCGGGTPRTTTRRRGGWFRVLGRAS
jgi:hypothetical protein